VRGNVTTISAAVAVVCAGLAGAGAAPADARVSGLAAVAGTDATGSGGWRNAREVPGTASLNVGGHAAILAVSCTSPGNCAAGGFYGSDSSDGGIGEALVVSQRDGQWGKARALPGTARLQTISSEILSISCSSRGNCAAGGSGGNCNAGGYYSRGGSRAFVVSERNGTWERAIEVPGTATLDAGHSAALFAISCTRARQCSAGGYYTDLSRHGQAFVVTRT